MWLKTQYRRTCNFIEGISRKITCLYCLLPRPDSHIPCWISMSLFVILACFSDLGFLCFERWLHKTVPDWMCFWERTADSSRPLTNLSSQSVVKSLFCNEDWATQLCRSLAGGIPHQDLSDFHGFLSSPVFYKTWKMFSAKLRRIF